MHMQLTYYLESNTLMATTQYGYRSGQSTELASQYYGIRLKVIYKTEFNLFKLILRCLQLHL